MSTIPSPPLTFWQGLRYCHDPFRVWFHFQQVNSAKKLAEHLIKTDIDSVRAAILEILEDEPFWQMLMERHLAITGYEPRGLDYMYLHEKAGSRYFHNIVQYTLVRLFKPEVMVETGGTPGNSSALILRAMERNGSGILHTIDLPPAEPLGAYNDGLWFHAGMPEGESSGWAIPDDLRQRHKQHLGDAKDLLPGVLDSLGTIDIFLHDSDHSYEHMTWEFEMAWAHLRPGGLLLSDDIFANAAWNDFTAQQGVPAYYTGNLGATRKPT